MTNTNEKMIWGIHPVLEFISSCPHLIQAITVQQGRGGDKIEKIIGLADQKGIQLKKTDRINLQDINHQGVIAQLTSFPLINDRDFLQELNSIEYPLLLALDSIQDPHNLGAILRSAAAGGVNGIILPKDRSASLSGTVAKISAGALTKLKICQTTNLARMLTKIQEANIWVYGTFKDNAESIYNTDFSQSGLCLVIGNEEKGIRPLIEKQCDFRVTIPMATDLDSLNASVATAVTLFEVRRQRYFK